ncbi:MAG TPA: DNA mismatch repair endonuclease MutL [Thermoplasmata archaeon]|nr:DNA mismatch repair endonuclease MutL [Thermoplasmata archaeon]
MSPSGPARRPIRRLSAETVERIAAGEVVERPASVAKELIENSVDAGAAHVTVRIEGGGLKLLEVADDGAGIPSDELTLAVERHATSKLDPVGRLEEIETLGFRGEALAAIASVSRFRLISRPPRSEVAEGISVTGGKVGRRFSEGRAPGTTVEVRDLFFNTPARRKFLKSPGAEQLELVRTVERLYLARPSVSLRVEAEGEDIAVLPAATQLPDAAARVLGSTFSNDSFAVRGFVPGGTVEGILGRPSTATAFSSGLYLAVNGRLIASRPILQAVRAAFGDYLPRARFPVGVLHLEVEPDRLDVNVHPTKREVRFANERELVDAIRERVRDALLSSPHIADVRDERAPSVLLPPPPPAPESPLAPSATSSAPPAFVQARLDAASPVEPPAEVPAATGHPALTLLGCVQALYWVAQSGEDLVIVDQHAASERVLYETVLRDGTLARQNLVEPVAVRLTGSQREALRAHSETVRASGFEIEQFGPEHFLVRSVPSYRGRRVRAEAVAALLDELAQGGRPTVTEGLRERRAATIACHAAIRAGDTVEPEEMRRVLAELYALPESSYSCPHGRPILLRFSRSRLDRWFLRAGA